MRAVALLMIAVAVPAAAEPLPPGALEAFVGPTSGVGIDAKRIGYGYTPGVFGAAAAWQPMSTERRLGFTLRWSVGFGHLVNGRVAVIDDVLRTVQMDVTAGVRFRPWATPSRYLTLRGGIGLLRANEPIIEMQRDFVGAVGGVGLDQYFGAILTGVDVRYGLIANGPAQISLVLRFGIAGP
jgi:hypothetical protein